jgi:hypothetical protein
MTRNLTLHYDRMMLLLDPNISGPSLGAPEVEVVNYPDGRFAVQFNGATLGFKVFDKIQTVQPGAIVDNKRLSAVLEQVKAHQATYPARQQRGHVARQRPPNNLEAPGLPSKGRGPTPQLYHGSSLIHRCLLGIPSGNPDATCYVGDHRARGEGGFLRDREIYPDASRDADSAFAECRKPTSCDRLPVHRSESPTGYSSAGCSPAEPASASPVTVNSSSIAIRRGNQIAAQPHCREAVQVALVVSAANASVISTLRAGCHFYLAPTPLLRAIPRDACRDEGPSQQCRPRLRRVEQRAVERTCQMTRD